MNDDQGIQQLQNQEQALQGRIGTAEQAQSGLEQQHLAGRAAETAPMDAQMKQALQQPLPERQQQAPAPEWKPEPIIDGKELNKFAMGIMAMGLIGGVASKGRWMNVASSLNGAMEGYLSGKEEVAKKKYEDYKTQFEAAKAKEQQANKEFEDLLKRRDISIRELQMQYEILAHKWDRVDAIDAVRRKDIQAMYKSVEHYDTSIARLSEQAREADDKIGNKLQLLQMKQELEGGSFDQKDQEYWTGVLQNGGSLPPGLARTPAGKKLVQDVMHGVAHSGISPKQMLSNQAEFQGEKSAQRTVGTQAGKIELASNMLETSLPSMIEAAKKVGLTKSTDLNEIYNAVKAHLSDSDFSNFSTQLRAATSDYAQFIGRGRITVHSDQEALRILNDKMGITALQGFEDAVNIERKNVTKAIEMTRGKHEGSSDLPPGFVLDK